MAFYVPISMPRLGSSAASDWFDMPPHSSNGLDRDEFYVPSFRRASYLNDRRSMRGWGFEPDDMPALAEDFIVEVEASGFHPEELSVEVRSDGSRILTVSGKHEVKSGAEDTKKLPNEGSIVSRQFSRSWRVPDHCDLDAIQSNLLETGLLRVTAPKSKKAIEEERLHKEEQQQQQRMRQLPRAGHDMDPQIHESDESFELVLHVDDFQPEDLSLHVNPDGLVSLEAKKEEKSGPRSVSRVLSRTLAFPPSCELDKLAATFVKERQQLKLAAPKKQRPAAGGRRELKIEVLREGSSNVQGKDEKKAEQ